MEAAKLGLDLRLASIVFSCLVHADSSPPTQTRAISRKASWAFNFLKMAAQSGKILFLLVASY